jgi:hypothetical protein
MSSMPPEDGLSLVSPGPAAPDGGAEALDALGEATDDCQPAAGVGALDGQADIGDLRNEFVARFNANDLEGLLAIVASGVECPDLGGEGADRLAEELEAVWERSPGVMLTRGSLDESPCAVAWRPDEDGRWVRAALVCFDAADEVLTLVEIPDDADALARVEAEEPLDGQEEWWDWAEWDRGEETPPPR